MDIHEQMTQLDYFVLAGYVTILLSIGFYVSFRKGHTEDMFLAGRDLRWPNVGLSIFGTNVSPSFMIGSCGIAYSSGMVAANFEWMAWVFLFALAVVFLPHYMNTQISTMPEFMSRRYNPACRHFLSIYALFSTMWMWVGGMLFVGGILLSQMLEWDMWVSVLFLAVISTSFTVTGGLTAVVITDSFQSVLMLAASIMLTAIGLFKVGSLDRLIHAVDDPSYWNLFRPASDATYPWHAVILGYPVMGIWFWCTDQTIVQRVLGAKNTRNAQLGCIFASWLKLLIPVIFLLPGICCRILHPDLDDPDRAYLTMVTTYLPPGLVGLIAAVLIAALVSSVDSGLNSFSTIFTLDVYQKLIKPDATSKDTRRIGQVVTILCAAVAVFAALAIASIEGMDLFSLGQSMIAFMAPPMAVVFLAGVVWNRATSTAAAVTLILGSIVSLGVGGVYLFAWPEEMYKPHFLLLSCWLFLGQAVLMILISLMTSKDPREERLPTLSENIRRSSSTDKKLWYHWGVLAFFMVMLYLIFN